MGGSRGHFSSAADTRHHALARLRVGVALVFAVPLLALAAAIVLLYRQEFGDAEQTLRGATRVAQEHALKVFDTNDMLLARMLDLLGNESDAYWLAHGTRLHDSLIAMSTGLVQVQGLFVNGADGRMLASDRVFPPARTIDFSDREYFVSHKGATGPRVFFTEQLVSRSTGERFFDMSRRRVFSDGRFAGTVNVSLRPEYFDRFWQELAEASPGLGLALVRDDGRLIARWPAPERPDDEVPEAHALMIRIAARDTEGTFEAESPFDGIQRITSFRRLADRPVYVVATFNRRDVIASWAKTAGLLALFVVPLTSALGWLAWLALRRTRKELVMAERLEQEAAARQRAELALAQSQKLETAGLLAAGVAHELNNLLMVVANHVQLLQRQSAASGFAAIERAIASGKRLTRQLLALSGRQPLATELVHLQERLPGFLGVVRAALPRSVDVALEVASDTAPIVTDAEELELALLNLVLNARDAMPHGGRIAISARNDQASSVVLDVVDNGSGIAPEILDRVREPLFTTKPRGKGSGLGLTQVQALSTAAGGSLHISSEVGKGTRVRLAFPVAQAPRERSGGSFR